MNINAVEEGKAEVSQSPSALLELRSTQNLDAAADASPEEEAKQRQHSDGKASQAKRILGTKTQALAEELLLRGESYQSSIEIPDDLLFTEHAIMLGMGDDEDHKQQRLHGVKPQLRCSAENSVTAKNIESEFDTGFFNEFLPTSGDR